MSAASETNADVIVTGVAPHAWLDRALLGSTLGLLRRAEVPVLVIGWWAVHKKGPKTRSAKT